jgi:hypothetical protein
VAEGDKDHGGIPVTPAIGLGGIDQPIDLGAGQVPVGPVLALGLHRGVVTVRKTVAGALGFVGNFISGFMGPGFVTVRRRFLRTVYTASFSPIRPYFSNQSVGVTGADFLQRIDEPGHFVGPDPSVQSKPIELCHFAPHAGKRVQGYSITRGLWRRLRRLAIQFGEFNKLSRVQVGDRPIRNPLVFPSNDVESVYRHRGGRSASHRDSRHADKVATPVIYQRWYGNLI